jgi:hypothetical protein
MQATGNEFKLELNRDFALSSNVAVLAQSLYILTNALKLNNYGHITDVLSSKVNEGLMHKGSTQKYDVYTILNAVSNDIPDDCKTIIHVDKGSKVSLTDVVSKIREIGQPILDKNYQILSNIIECEDELPPLKTKNTVVYLMGHYLVADLSVLSDFETFKTQIDLMYKSFTTLGRPYKLCHDRNNWSQVFFRDTGILSPPGTGLAILGSLYKLDKITLPEGSLNRMDLLLERDRELFNRYALRDAEIALIHGLSVEYFNAKNGNGAITVPTTVASMAKKYVLKYWNNHNINDINTHTEYHVGNFSKLFTPKGIQTTENLALITPMFVGGYRGGRNESFAYGFERSTDWYDYDLVSAYTTAMALAGTPNYSSAFTIDKGFSNDKPINPKTIRSEFLDNDLVLNSYSVFTVDFKFEEGTLYPNLPVHISKNLTVYPLEGTSQCTGLELKVAIDRGCSIERVISAAIIPFKDVPWIRYSTEFKHCSTVCEADTFEKAPYFGVIKELQAKRRNAKANKNSFDDLFYKLMGNTIYGQVALGLSAKSLFNSRTNSMNVSTPSDLTNPVLACWITGFIRAVLSESLNEVEIFGGKCVSCTTDGFISNLKDLESSPEFGRGILASYFRYGRKNLSGDETLLEMKHNCKGIATWCVRGQLGLGKSSDSEVDKSMQAITGFQRKQVNSLEQLRDLVVAGLSSRDKSIVFMQMSLRGGKDIYDKGGHVTPKYEEKTFRVIYDQRRKINPSAFMALGTDSHINNLLSTSPWKNTDVCRTYLKISKLGMNKYAENTGYPILNSRYKNYREIATRQFVRALLQGYLGDNPFSSYKELSSFIKSLNHSISTVSIANNKRPQRPFLINSVPKVPSTIQFFELIKQRLIPDLNTEIFFKKV